MRAMSRNIRSSSWFHGVAHRLETRIVLFQTGTKRPMTWYERVMPAISAASRTSITPD